ncbi:rhodanese-like domain-containing protein [Ligilactobacillus sp. WILCCON 0076]|uniref:Rhodanese-like domain-containing protein n=1 Tax=Ligilactobacillus ubinensis TaxID=2876789 RepID=A0A9X2FK21_9LACO|nr:rhodanese-like domain-containing protein [Ligilactobacillus ubinensis]MCP0886790.1 rhodanese-like domain-containing protein [Ligilactobacillus ubinensis]
MVLILAWMIGVQLYTWLLGRRVAKIIENNEFKEGMHKAQVIDLREADSFKTSHILGARNMPYSQFKIYKTSLRKDMPVYLYEQGKTLSIRAASQLYKAGFKDIFILKGGLNKWDGKLKKK